MDTRNKKILDFLRITDGAKNVMRAGYLGDGSRHESIAEHMWHLAIWALLFHGEIGFETDLLRTLKLVLTHDLVEIHAGDTYAFDDEGIKGQHEREKRGAEKLFSILPEDLCSEFRALWDEFEECNTPESRLAKALDHSQGFFQNCISGGKSWKERGITRERTLFRTDPARETDPAFAEILDLLYETADMEDAWGKP
jgi:putative hydrolase of HD superfamily